MNGNIKMNSARRLFRILERARAGNPSASVAIVCYHAAGLTTAGLSEHQELNLGLEVISKIRKLADDVERQAQTLSSANRYSDCFARLRNYIHPAHSTSAWDGIKNQVYAEGFLAILELLAEIFPADSEDVANEDIARILEEVNFLQAAIESSSLPPFHAHFSRILLTSLKRALIDYAFIGAEAIRTANRETIGVKMEMEANAVSLKAEALVCTEEQNELIVRVQGAVEKVVSVSKGIYYIGGATALMAKAVEKLQLFSR